MNATLECKFSLFTQSLTSIRFCRITKMRRTIYLTEKCIFFLILFNFGNVVRQTNCQSSDIRLSTNVMPTSYDIHLNIDIEKREFNGSETIYVIVYESTNLIELHSLNLTIQKIQILNHESQRVLDFSAFEDDENQKLILTLSERLEKDLRYEIKIAFEGEIKDDMKGLYQSSYYDNLFFYR
jgi:hypothetical protein